VLEKLLPINEKLKCFLSIGGHSINEELESLEKEKPNIVIGTVGRIYDLVSRKALNLRAVKVLIIDEADLMIEQGN